MYEKELHTALRLARRAATIARYYYKRSSRVHVKDDESLVTAADRRIEWLLVEGISSAFPGDRIVGEEHGHRHGSAGRFWAIDPIDGTRHFIHKTDNFATLIGLIVRGRPVLGIVSAPSHQKIYYGVRGHGSFVLRGARRRRLHVRHRAERVRDATMVVGHPKHKSSPLSQWVRDQFKVTRTVPVGSAGLDLCAVAEGRADFTVNANVKLNIWDSAQGEVILEEAGGKVADVAGKTLRYRWGHWSLPRGFLGTTPELAQEIFRLLRKWRVPEKFRVERKRVLKKGSH